LVTARRSRLKPSSQQEPEDPVGKWLHCGAAESGGILPPDAPPQVAVIPEGQTA